MVDFGWFWQEMNGFERQWTLILRQLFGFRVFSECQECHAHGTAWEEHERRKTRGSKRSSLRPALRLAQRCCAQYTNFELESIVVEESMLNLQNCLSWVWLRSAPFICAAFILSLLVLFQVSCWKPERLLLLLPIALSQRFCFAAVAFVTGCFFAWTGWCTAHFPRSDSRFSESSRVLCRGRWGYGVYGGFDGWLSVVAVAGGLRSEICCATEMCMDFLSFGHIMTVKEIFGAFVFGNAQAHFPLTVSGRNFLMETVKFVAVFYLQSLPA